MLNALGESTVQPRLKHLAHTGYPHVHFPLAFQSWSLWAIEDTRGLDTIPVLTRSAV